ncbi:MAG TPA: hypothetical protein VHS53_06325, partial [Mucilaginibacter sp.]|nr:hypothetical protein [Mucilaginibacter sp.]
KLAGKRYMVSYNLSDFTKGQSVFAVRHSARTLASDSVNASDALDLLYYIVYDNGGHAVNAPLVQDSTMNNMGMIADSLPSGTYTVVFIGGKKGLTLNNYGVIIGAGFGYPGSKWQDTFWDSFSLTVDNNNVSKDVTLCRVVGKLELQLLDNIPANADSLVMTINPEAQYMSNNGGQPQGQQMVTYSMAIPAGAKGHPNFVMDRLIGNTATPFIVSIKCKDSGNNVIASATASSVSVHANMKTILSGNLFATGPASQNFTIKADTAWGGSANYSF